MLASDALTAAGMEGLDQGCRLWHLPENRKPTPLPGGMTDTSRPFPTPLLGSRGIALSWRRVSPVLAHSLFSFPEAGMPTEVTSCCLLFLPAVGSPEQP